MSVDSKKLQVFPVAIGENSNYSSCYPLGVLSAYAKHFDNGALLDSVLFDAITPADLDGMLKRLNEGEFRNDAVYLFSSYVWNYDLQLVFAKQLKERLSNILIVIGGPHIPKDEKKCREFLTNHPYFDIAVNGEGENTLVDLLQTCVSLKANNLSLVEADYSKVLGITFRGANNKIYRTESRPRIKDFSILPSPYLTGEFDHWPDEWFTLMITETNRGCPFGCTFCDWGGATLSKIYKFELERINAEIVFAVKRKVETLHFCDANFGAFQRDVEIAQTIANAKKEYGYPKYASMTFSKNATKKVTDIVRIFAAENLIESAAVSLQTVNDDVLSAVKRNNIKTSSYENLIEVFDELNMPAATDILIGLPDQTYDTFKNDLQFCFDRKLMAAVFLVSILPNAPMADEAYMEKYDLKIDDRYLVVSSSSFTEAERNTMISLRLAESFLIQEKVFKYVLLYLQIEHKIKALDIVDIWLKTGFAKDTRYPLTAWAVENILKVGGEGVITDWLMIQWGTDAKVIFDDVTPFYHEVLSIVSEKFSVDFSEFSNEIDSLFQFQKTIMPNPQKGFPAPVELQHDVVGYFKQFNQFKNFLSIPEGFQKLQEFDAATLNIPKQNIKKRFSYTKLNIRIPGWPLDAGLPV